MAWTGVTAIVMFLLAFGKRRTGQALGNLVLLAEGKVTVVDGLLAVAVLIGLVLNAVVRLSGSIGVSSCRRPGQHVRHM